MTSPQPGPEPSLESAAAPIRNGHGPSDRGRFNVWLRFLIPSSLGAVLLLVPLPFRGKVSIVLGHLVDAAQAAFGPQIPTIVATVIVISALVALTARSWPMSSGPLVSGPLAPILRPTWAGTLLRVVGAVIAVMVIARFGPEWLIGDATGGLILRDLLPIVLLIFFAASFVLPCLTDFGLMELVGGIVSPIFRPLLGLPGRSAVDAVASWLGAASVGVLITADQYKRGFYTEREAAVIATTFSVVSIAFAYVIIDFVGLGAQFVPFYLTVMVCGLATALICPLLPPLRGKPDRYSDGRTRSVSKRVVAAGASDAASGPSPLAAATPLAAALDRAAKSPPFGQVLRRALVMVLDIWLGLLPMVALIGTLAIVIAETTPLFHWLGLPFLPLLQLLRIPEADAAAPAMVVGFADQFLPVVLGRPLESEITRFVIACTSVNQLIYLSEVGVVILRSPLPLNLRDLAIIFVIRTLVALPITALAAHLIF